MPTEIPLCRNFKEDRQCSRSDMRLVEETDEAWVFVCKCCELVSVVAKDGISDRSKFELQRKRMHEQAELIRRWERRKKIFSVRA